MIRNAVAIAPCTEEDIVHLNALQVKPFQQIYCDLPSKVLAQKNDGISEHVIKKNGVVVGMFCVDTRFHFGLTFAKFDTPGIRNLVIDQDSQAKGFGTESCRMLPSYLKGVAPRARGVYAMINTSNAGAYKCCIRGGWTDTQEQYNLGRTGPQHILWMPLR
jgi:hypothetical protein